MDGVTLSLNRGTTLGVVGESGSGKTIFARSVMNLLPKENVRRSGSVRFLGRELTELDAKNMRELCGKDIAMVFQDPMSSLNPVMTIGKQITESLRLHLRMKRHEAHITAVTLLRSVNIPEAERRFAEYPHQLSGGMRQRVMIALALACGPRLLFADEPTTALDVTVQADILNLLQDQQTERFMAMVLVTHDLGVVAGRTDEIAVMYAGKVVEQAPTSVLFAHMLHPVHRGPAALDPAPREPEPHPAAGHHRPPAGSPQPPTRVLVRPALPVRRRALLGRGAAARGGRHPRPPLRLLPPPRLAGQRRGLGTEPRRRPPAGARAARLHGPPRGRPLRPARRRDGDRRGRRAVGATGRRTSRRT